MVNKALDGEPDFAVSSGTGSVRPPSISAKIAALTGVLVTDDKGQLHIRRVRARVTSGPDRGRESVLDAGTLLVGSHADNDLVMRDSSIGKYHLEIALVAGGVRVRDLGAEGGTTFNGIPVKNQVLPAGSEIVLGKSTVQLLAADVLVPHALSDRVKFGPIVGRTTVMRALFATLERVAPTDTALLIDGEVGTGRSTLARAIHNASRFAATPMFVLDFSSPMIDRTTVTSLAQRTDSFTLLIEHIDRAPKSLWGDLLDLYQRREDGSIDLRILATSDLGFVANPSEGRTRIELLSHVAAVRITLPALRDRLDDVSTLIDHFVREQCGVVAGLSDEEIPHARERKYPQNVTELKNFVTRALAADAIARPQLPRAGIERARAALLFPLNAKPKALDPVAARQRLADAFARDAMRAVFEQAGENTTLAAERWGISEPDWLLETERLAKALVPAVTESVVASSTAKPAASPKLLESVIESAKGSRTIVPPAATAHSKAKSISGVHPTKPARKAATKRR